MSGIAKRFETWRSSFLAQDVNVARWGESGVPVLLFPTAGGDAEEIERFRMIPALEPLLEAGKIQLFSCDSVPGQCWVADQYSASHCSWVQNRFDEFLHQELAPYIHHLSDGCGLNGHGIVTAGASLGAFFALAAVCRHPETFGRAVCLSGKFDLIEFLDGEEMTLDFYYSSPLHFLPRLEDERLLGALRGRFVQLVTGRGAWERPENATQVAELLTAKGVPHRVDDWGASWDHDWPSWRRALPHYLARLDE
ncbi:MAG: esterase family protein [Thermoanaerobaculia bacterium]